MSEEDIKILEELLEEGFEAMCPLEAQALENLIKAYKELEEENRIFALEGCRVRLKMYIDNNYIPVSLVEEKIEKLDNQIKEVTNNIENSVDEEKAYWKKEKHDLNMQRYVLQELLEKRK